MSLLVDHGVDAVIELDLHYLVGKIYGVIDAFVATQWYLLYNSSNVSPNARIRFQTISGMVEYALAGTMFRLKDVQIVEMPSYLANEGVGLLISLQKSHGAAISWSIGTVNGVAVEEIQWVCPLEFNTHQHLTDPSITLIGVAAMPTVEYSVDGTSFEPVHNMQVLWSQNDLFELRDVGNISIYPKILKKSNRLALGVIAFEYGTVGPNIEIPVSVNGHWVGKKISKIFWSYNEFQSQSGTAKGSPPKIAAPWYRPTKTNSTKFYQTYTSQYMSALPNSGGGTRFGTIVMDRWLLDFQVGAIRFHRGFLGYYDASKVVRQRIIELYHSKNSLKEGLQWAIDALQWAEKPGADTEKKTFAKKLLKFTKSMLSAVNGGWKKAFPFSPEDFWFQMDYVWAALQVMSGHMKNLENALEELTGNKEDSDDVTLKEKAVEANILATTFGITAVEGQGLDVLSKWDDAISGVYQAYQTARDYVEKTLLVTVPSIDPTSPFPINFRFVTNADLKPPTGLPISYSIEKTFDWGLIYYNIDVIVGMGISLAVGSKPPEESESNLTPLGVVGHKVGKPKIYYMWKGLATSQTLWDDIGILFLGPLIALLGFALPGAAALVLVAVSAIVSAVTSDIIAVVVKDQAPKKAAGPIQSGVAGVLEKLTFESAGPSAGSMSVEVNALPNALAVCSVGAYVSFALAPATLYITAPLPLTLPCEGGTWATTLGMLSAHKADGVKPPENGTVVHLPVLLYRIHISSLSLKGVAAFGLLIDTQVGNKPLAPMKTTLEFNPPRPLFPEEILTFEIAVVFGSDVSQVFGQSAVVMLTIESNAKMAEIPLKVDFVKGSTVANPGELGLFWTLEPQLNLPPMSSTCLCVAPRWLVFLDDFHALAAFGRIARKKPCGICPIFLRFFSNDSAQIRLGRENP